MPKPKILDEIMSAKEASILLGFNEKYIYFLYSKSKEKKQRQSLRLLEGSVSKIGNILLITKSGYKYLKCQLDKEEDKMKNIKPNLNFWDDILIATEASLSLGVSSKYIYFLYVDNSPMLLEGSVRLVNNHLFITRAGYEHLKPLVKKEEDLENSQHFQSLI